MGNRIGRSGESDRAAARGVRPVKRARDASVRLMSGLAAAALCGAASAEPVVWTDPAAPPGVALGHELCAVPGQLFVGVPADDVAGDEAGSVRVLGVPESGAPVPVQTLLPGTPGEGERFGWSIASDGALLAVGSGQDLGEARVRLYARAESGAWLPAGELVGTAFDQFGRVVAVHGGVVAVGIPGADVGDGSSASGAGAVRLFTASPKVGGAWDDLGLTQPGALGSGDRLGSSVAMGVTARPGAGERAVVVAGAPLSESPADAGAAWVWERDGGGWSAPVEIASADPVSRGHFGHAVGVHRAGLLVSSPDAGSGRVEFLTDAGPGYAPAQTLTAPVGFGSLRFGEDLSVSGDRLAVGASGPGDRSGAVFVYAFEDGAWSLTETIEGTPELGGTSDVASDFGRAVAVGDDAVWVGAPSLHEAALTNAAPARDHLEAMRAQRVDVVIFGDSNANFGGDGWATGIPGALDRRAEVACFGAGAFGANINNGNGANLGDLERDINGGGPLGSVEGAPQGLTDLMPRGDAFFALHLPAWLDRGESVASTVNNGVAFEAQHPMGVGGTLRARYQYAAFSPEVPDEPSSGFRALFRRGSSPFTPLADEAVSTLDPGLAEPFGLRTGALVLPAGDRAFPLNFRFSRPGVEGLTGRVFLAWSRVSNDDRGTGWAVTTRSWEGGKGLRVFTEKYRAYEQAAHRNFFGFLREDAEAFGQAPRTLVFFSSGLNDRNDDALSVGDSPAPSDTRAGYRDNAQAFYDELRGTWGDAGWAPSGLAGLLASSHLVGEDPGVLSSRRLIEYNRAVRGLARENPALTGFDWSWIVDARYLGGQGLYDGAGPAHFEPEGYRRLGAMLVDALFAPEGPERAGLVVRFPIGTAPGCPADWDGDGSVNVLDVVAFLGAFQGGDPGTDFDDDGVLNVLDVVGFITAWNAGCP